MIFGVVLYFLLAVALVGFVAMPAWRSAAISNSTIRISRRARFAPRQ